uniref:Uncharacterized protein n=1 Tax=Trichogramma kaykai TaxID=54128 RepID=A0ABD2WXG1_9HYME
MAVSAGRRQRQIGAAANLYVRIFVYALLVQRVDAKMNSLGFWHRIGSLDDIQRITARVSGRRWQRRRGWRNGSEIVCPRALVTGCHNSLRSLQRSSIYMPASTRVLPVCVESFVATTTLLQRRLRYNIPAPLVISRAAAAGPHFVISSQTATLASSSSSSVRKRAGSGSATNAGNIAIVRHRGDLRNYLE